MPWRTTKAFNNFSVNGRLNEEDNFRKTLL